MNDILFYYHRVNPTTWAYLSSLLMIGLFFKFSRFWSVRNLDLILLILLAPGLLLVHYGQETRQTAFALAQQEAADSAASTTPDAAKASSRDVPSAAPATDVSRSAADSSGAYNPMAEIMGDFNSEDSGDAPPLTPTQSLARAGRLREYFGYLWLFIAGGLLLVRLLLDSTMVRRPLLEPNLSPGGLAFLGIALFIFLAGNVATTPPVDAGPATANRPGYSLLQRLIFAPTVSIADRESAMPVAAPAGDNNMADQAAPGPASAAVSKLVAILAQLASVIAIAGIGYRHFDNMKMGIGAAMMYMMLPYTSQMFGLASHAVPAALLLWGVLFYRRPLTAGVFIGLAASVGYYPFFLLPLWLSFYWQRGLARFVIGVASMVVAMTLLLALGASDFSSYLFDVRKMFGVLPFRMRPEDLGGIWSVGWDAVYRIPMLTAFVVLSFSFSLWPAQKNLGTLLSCSAAVMVAAQFWHGGYADPVTGLGGLDAGGLYMAWYLPLLILTIFRPNLEDRVALTVLGEGWFPRRKWAAAAMERAA